MQVAAIPPLLAGRDVCAQAGTGTGKTLAFALPLLQGLDRTRGAPGALVLGPTRELAEQVAAEVRRAGRRIPGLRVQTLVGGQPSGPQVRALEQGVHVVVGTPGRVLEHLRRGTLDPARLRLVVLDEADRMLDLGFVEDVSEILEGLAAGRQTALFSATLPATVVTLAESWLRSPVRVAVGGGSTEVVARAITTLPERRIDLVSHLLCAEQPSSALVFVETRASCGEMADALRERGHAAAAIHGDLLQEQRDLVLARFRIGSVRVLVATDVAARGLDIAGLDLVLNSEPPRTAETWVHRAGRTGRMGEPGKVWTVFVGAQAKRIELYRQAGRDMELVSSPPDLPKGARPLAAAWRTLEVGAGRKDKLRPGDLLGALTGDVGLPAEAVGRILVQDRRAYVGVRADAAKRALAGLIDGKVKGRRVRVELAAGEESAINAEGSARRS